MSKVLSYYLVLHSREIIKVQLGIERVQRIVQTLPEIHGTSKTQTIVRYESQVLWLSDQWR